jgi:His-Xaa-Ser system protein HxsD
MPKLNGETRTVCLTFDEKVYSLNAVKKAAFQQIRYFTTDITIVDEQIQCLLVFSSPVTDEQTLRFASDFKKEVLDQDLRERLRAETEAVRNVILAHAFSKTGLVNNEPLSGN